MNEKREDAFSLIKRNGVVDEIINTIKQALLQGTLKPGDRIPTESELVQQLGVGRGAVREAMKMLSALGVIEIRRGDGTYITSHPSANVLSPLIFAILLEAGTSLELLELRSMIEVGYCQLAARKATEQDFQNIEAKDAIWTSFANTPRSDIDRLTQLDLEFHFAILEATHNPSVIRLGKAVEELFYASIRKTLLQEAGIAWGVGGHQQIIEAMRSGSPAAIQEAVESSLMYWANVLQSEQR